MEATRRRGQGGLTRPVDGQEPGAAVGVEETAEGNQTTTLDGSRISISRTEMLTSRPRSLTNDV